jgi:hypothetical protein
MVGASIAPIEPVCPGQGGGLKSSLGGVRIVVVATDSEGLTSLTLPTMAIVDVVSVLLLGVSRRENVAGGPFGGFDAHGPGHRAPRASSHSRMTGSDQPIRPGESRMESGISPRRRMRQSVASLMPPRRARSSAAEM